MNEAKNRHEVETETGPKIVLSKKKKYQQCHHLRNEQREFYNWGAD